MKKQLTPLAQRLRKTPTEAEKHLWYSLQRNNLGHKFRKQAVIGKYVVDFVCYEHKLIIEVDGGQHAQSQGDQQRDQWLARQGFRVLRFWNNDVLSNRDGVLSKIMECLAPLLNPPHSAKGGSASGGEGGGNDGEKR